MDDSQVLLSVLAHPDDESFGMGGTLALYASRGAAVHLVCATRGEAGSMDEDCLDGYGSIAERREAELRCAAGVLGLASVHFLDYRDSGMPNTPDNQHPNALCAQPLEAVAAKVAAHIRRLKPQVVLTFDPIGGYKHPDHIAIHNATVRAFHLAGDPGYVTDLPPYQPPRLYFHVMPKTMMRVGVALLRLFGRDPHKFGRNQDIDLADLVSAGDFPTHAWINYRSVRQKKDQAAACHASQLGGMPRRGPLGWFLQLFNQSDQFMRAYPEPEKGLRERDLFPS
jgi:LmbE family N-acetylglucosaminyl deacetylase